MEAGRTRDKRSTPLPPLASTNPILRKAKLRDRDLIL